MGTATPGAAEEPDRGTDRTGTTGYDIAFGTLEEARAMIGHRTPVRWGPVPVSRSMIVRFAGLVRDANASYWDEDFARTQWGRRLAPPGMLLTCVMPLEWEPGQQGDPVPLLTAQVPLPGDSFVNASQDVEFLLPIREGDRLSVEEELVDVSDEKRTGLGVGHFVTTLSTYRRQDGQVVARQTNVLFRFTSQDGGQP